jgi:hypothetical protein
LNVQLAEEKIKTSEEKVEPKPIITAPENPKTWAEYRLWTLGKLMDIRKQYQTGNTAQKKVDNDVLLENKQRRQFYEEAASFLKEQNAQTWDELYPDMPREEKNASKKESNAEVVATQRVQYKLMRGGWGTDPVMLHLLDSYDELFEACWTGDNAKIQQLCLPSTKKGTNSAATPLQISVKCSGAEVSTGGLYVGDGEHTPLSVAVAARRWDTVKLIMEIVDAQWKRPEKDVGAARRFQQAIDLSKPFVHVLLCFRPCILIA